ncbi:MAG TPA: acetyl-CoA C-acetyltransferase [Candidatus Obscuribacter sp.]|nr:acetyl-CoA C-acetyltransferase [Candidatus Obscuribacter sp.]MBK9277961.1 acetyl-CoA C-acetyltransferase [Candidatus Obscuribacter sp.]MBL8082290.1 acetyl-CoA C-acetyltransferase [Candidatus Obscuribacter sp.]MDX1989683.1 acetyl-CoA C-acetyltransferase [Candidatus Obscuribacter sp.]HMW89227.1 acetyl-CoA C-acetyltransferase [Candidatus Obscuribacter sp.]
MNDRETVIVDGLRTPFGRMGGALAQLSAVKLATPLIKEIVERNKIKPDSIDEVIVGQVVLAGCGQIPSRQALLAAGLPNTTESTTVNKVCASGMRAVTLADLRIRANDADIIVAGGMESMSQAPYIVEANSARFGKRMGHVAFQDAMLVDGLECPVTGVHMAVHGAKVAEEFSIGREEQDEWAVRSHKKAVEAQEKGAFKKEILAVEVPAGKGQTKLVDKDESPRADTSKEALAKLKPVFYDKGSITAGNAPGVNDGACMLLVMSAGKAKELGLKPLAKIVSHASIGQDVPYLATVPALATEKALKKAGLKVEDLDLMEINEAFAAVALKSIKMLGIDPEKVNVNGGAIALGHPIGASGARILLTLAREMESRGAKYGAAAICSGTAQGDCVILSREGLD